MKADQYSKFDSIKVKARANYQCKLCGANDRVQAHAPNGDHSDWRKGICLCADCHSKQHPDVPRNLFFTETQQPYWPNISARALGLEFNCHNRTVIRAAKALGIPHGKPLSDKNKSQLSKRITKSEPEPLKSAIREIERIQRRNENICRYRREHKMSFRALGRMFKLSHTQIMNIARHDDDGHNG